MTTRPREIPTLTDPLGETLHLLRLNGSFYCRSELTAPWGVEMPAFDGYMMFHIVTAGHCWLEVEGEAPRLLQQGSLTLVPRGNGHRIRSSPEVTVEPLFEIPVERVSERYEVMRHGDGALTQLTCGVVSFDHQAGQQLIAQLPGLLQIDSLNDEDDSWLQSSLRFIAREARELRPGGETVITHLADILIIQAIRSWIDTAPEANRGWLAALRDNHVGRALAAIHRQPEKRLDRGLACQGSRYVAIGIFRQIYPISRRIRQALSDPVADATRPSAAAGIFRFAYTARRRPRLSVRGGILPGFQTRVRRAAGKPSPSCRKRRSDKMTVTADCIHAGRLCVTRSGVSDSLRIIQPERIPHRRSIKHFVGPHFRGDEVDKTTHRRRRQAPLVMHHMNRPCGGLKRLQQ